MVIGERIRAFREAKNLSQADIEERTGLLRAYTSRVENGHTVPSLETLEKFARALEVPLYQLFHEGEQPPELPKIPKSEHRGCSGWGSSGKDARILARLQRLLIRMNEKDRKLLLSTAQKIASRTSRRTKS